MSFIKQPLFIFSFWLLVLIAILHNSAVFLYFYWTLWWFDLLMHFLGGLWASTFLLWLIYERKGIKKSPRGLFFTALFISILIGLGWETFEFFGNVIELPKEILDSSLDMVMDVFGGIMAFFYSKKYLVVKN